MIVRMNTKPIISTPDVQNLLLEVRDNTISGVAQQVQEAIKQTVLETMKNMPTQQVVNITIQQLTIPIHIYNAPIGNFAQEQHVDHLNAK